jgi:uncharacterized protein (TIGR02246 family)
MRRTTFVVAGLALAALTLIHLLPLGAKQTAPANPDEAAVRKMLAGYTAAYNKGDAAGASQNFATDCEFTDDTGRVLNGRDAIRKELEELFTTTKGLKLDAGIDAIRKLSNDAYHVRGNTTVAKPDGTSDKSSYALVIAKRDGNWQIADAREISDVAAESGPLDGLAWMVGDWHDSSEDLQVTAHCHWTANKHFLMRTHTVTNGDGDVELQGTEVIAYDPTSKQIRSWMFDSDGTVTESVWTNNGKVWTANAKGFLADGRKASATYTYTVVDDNTMTYASSNRDVGGQLQPNVPDIKMIRDTVVDE